MKQNKDLSWLSAPSFFLILMMIGLNTKKQNLRRPPEKVKPEISVMTPARQS